MSRRPCDLVVVSLATTILIAVTSSLLLVGEGEISSSVFREVSLPGGVGVFVCGQATVFELVLLFPRRI